MSGCAHCRKKTVILIQCKCSQSFCIKHQLPEKHTCTFVPEKFQLEKTTSPKKIEVI